MAGRERSARLGRVAGAMAAVLCIAGAACAPNPTNDGPTFTNGNVTTTVTPVYTRTVAPEDPTKVPIAPPAVLPTITCERVGPSGRQTVFGYLHVGKKSADIVSTITDGGTEVPDAGQPSRYLPGNHPSRFAPTTVSNPVWVLWVPAVGQEQVSSTGTPFPLVATEPPPLWKVTISANSLTPCGPSVPEHFVTSTGVDVTPRPTDVVRDLSNKIGAYAIDTSQIGTDGSLCSAGGVALPPLIVHGDPVINLVPLAPSDVYRVDTFGGDTYVRTLLTKRQVADVGQQTWFTDVVDVYGRCDFGGTIVQAADPYWNDSVSDTWIFKLSADGTQIAVGRIPPGGGVRFR